MIAAICLGLLCCLLLGLRLLSGPRPDALTAAERVYLLLSPLPLGLSFVAPALFLRWAMDAGMRAWSNRLVGAGLWISVALAIAGMALVIRRFARGHARDPRLLAGLAVAAFPACLAGLAMLLLSLL